MGTPSSGCIIFPNENFEIPSLTRDVFKYPYTVKMEQQPLLKTKLYKVRYDGKDYYGPHLTTILHKVNEGILNPAMHLTQTCMSLCVRGLLKRGTHKGATGTIIHAGNDFTVPEGGTWVPAYEIPSKGSTT